MIYRFLVCGAAFMPLANPAAATATTQKESIATFEREARGGLFSPLDLSPFRKEGGAPSTLQLDGVPFHVIDNGENVLSLERAGWPEWKVDPGRYSEAYDRGEIVEEHQDLDLFIAQAPKRHYTAAYLLAYAEEDEALSNRVTIRAGTRNQRGKQLLMHDFSAVVPRSPKGQRKLVVVRVPFTTAFAQDVEGKFIQFEITKELRLARRAPDPCRFRWRPLGLPSGVKIAAITLEESPIQLSVTAAQPGKLFVAPNSAAFDLELANTTEREQAYSLVARAGETRKREGGTIQPKGKKKVRIAMPELDPGHYSLEVDLLGGEKEAEPLFTYQTFFGVLPEDTRAYREESPFGTWGTKSAHFYPDDPAAVGPIYKAIGLRYGMFNYGAENRSPYGVLKGNSFKVNMGTKEPEKAAEGFVELRSKEPDLAHELLIFHEDGISGGHATRIPDLFHDNPPYQLSDEEKKRFDAMWDLATKAAKSMRAAYPDAKIHLGNGGLPLREEFYRNQFPKELFDTAGNEAGTFSRPPETQPPDVIGNNSSLWMDRAMLDAYGYAEKGISQCHEIIYPGTNPGNLSYRSQADYLVRHLLHSMAWMMPKIRPVGIVEPGTSYRFSNWGGVALMTARPDIAPKPSAVALATLTQVLDGALYQRFLETGSDGAYLLHFDKKGGGHVYPFWVVRGERDFKLRILGAKQVALVSLLGKESAQEVKDGFITVTASASPNWLVLPSGATVERVELGTPVHPQPEGKIVPLAALDSMQEWSVVPERSFLLDHYNPLTPRRKGNFLFEASKEGDRSALKVTARAIATGKETMPMYSELEHTKGIPLPGKPTEIGLWVKGNSGWGRVIYELEDASGQKWQSIGARSKGGSAWMADWLGEKLSKEYTPGETADWNTDDGWGLSRINFDGWRYLSFPLPGQYPGEGYYWPANSQWRWDKDGVVHYPLTLRKVIIELPEKVLYLTRYAPAKEPAIYLRDLSCTQGDNDRVKTEPAEYVESAQIDVR